MTATAIRSALAVALLLTLCGCGSEQADSPINSSGPAKSLSDRFGVCMHLPTGYTFSNHEEAIDFDVGRLKLQDAEVDVYVGYHPDFSRSAKRVAIGAGHFKFLGEETSKGQDRILFGHDRNDRRGPIFVMFSGADLDSVRQPLRTEGLVVDCRTSKAGQ